jgi:hypothetical protein
MSQTTLAVAADRSAIIARLRALRPDDQRRWGKMTASQMVCHLADSFRAVLGLKAVSMNTNLLKRSVLKWLALNAPLPWPHGYPTRPEMDQQIGGTRPVEFARDGGPRAYRRDLQRQANGLRLASPSRLRRDDYSGVPPLGLAAHGSSSAPVRTLVMPETPDSGEWEVWYRDTFDRECPPRLEVRGQGLVEGLVELWARYLFESIDGFSQFSLRWKGQAWIEIAGDVTGARRLRQWVFGSKEHAERGYVTEADPQVLRVVAAAHATLALAGQTSEAILSAAASAADRDEFESLLTTPIGR